MGVFHCVQKLENYSIVKCLFGSFAFRVADVKTMNIITPHYILQMCSQCKTKKLVYKFAFGK